jgi:UDP-N-acetylmuramoyl-tripeptide--D-alanyl-D-alanine ligase
MSGTPLDVIARLCGGVLENADGAEGTTFAPGAIGIDSRSLIPGQIFVAIEGERDGHDFVGDAAARGALAALVRGGKVVSSPRGFPLIRVDSPVAALQRWAKAHREAMPALVVAVTGSSGKTTTKDRIAGILSMLGPTHATPGNLNNHIGVPVTLLGIAPQHRFAVVEIAMNHPGEIAPLSRLARPHHAVITTIGWAHIGAFGTREAILREKLDILAGCDTDGVLVHELDPWLIERLPAAVLGRARRTFGMDRTSDFHPDRVEFQLGETRFRSAYTGEVRYLCPGYGPLKAALAACLVGTMLGVPGESAKRSLEDARPRPLRMEPRPLGPATALLDCYNASPESSLGAIEFLGQVRSTGRRWLAFGEMRELGQRSREAHERVGERAAVACDGVFFLGDECSAALERFRTTPGGSKKPARVFESGAINDLARELVPLLAPGDVVLFKGARLMAMERVYEACLRLIAAGEKA